MHADPPSAGDVTAHTLLNCLVREVCGPQGQARLDGPHLVVRLPRRDLVVRVALRRASLTGAHRFTGPVQAWAAGRWSPIGWRALAAAVHDELERRTGTRNDEFLGQVASSHDIIAVALARPRAPHPEPYLDSEQSLVFGHRFHPTPKARSGPLHESVRYAPELGAQFRLRHLAVRREVLREECAEPAFADVFDRLGGPADEGHALVPVHPWQHRLLLGNPALRAALRDGRVVDLGPAGPPVTPTASVRTVHHPGAGVFLKLSLSVRITNCLRRNAGYELAGAVALTRLLRPVAADLRARFPSTALLAEPASRTVDLGDADLAEGLGVIAREGLGAYLVDGATPLLAAAIADEHSRGPASAAALLGRGGGTAEHLVAWWDAYLAALVSPVLHAYLAHGVVLEPHLQNVVVGVRGDGLPVQVFLRDLEGTKLVASRHRDALAALPEPVRAQVAYDAERGWNRVVYCLVVNHLSEVLAVLADQRPPLERLLWSRVRDRFDAYRRDHGSSPPLRALLAGAPLPAKANLLTRWQRRADRHAGYVALPNPLAAHGPPTAAPLAQPESAGVR